MPLNQPHKLALPYFQDSSLLFARFAHKPWAVFLDSAYPNSQQGRFDMIAFDPVCTLETYGLNTLIRCRGHVEHSPKDPFLLLKRHLGAARQSLDDLPFNGGAIGYFSYDLARRIENLPNIAQDLERIADMAVGIYEWAVVIDHEKQQSWLISYALTDENRQALAAQFSDPALPLPCDFKVLTTPVSNMDESYYAQAFNRIKRYLQEGDCYQVNLTQRFESLCMGDPWGAYLKLRRVNAAPFSAYLNLPQVQVLSSSPERFLKVTQGAVETKPIKGTRRRKANAQDDAEQIRSLLTSAKDRAENVMIVDLLRNDLGKCCVNGSVRVPKLFDVETYATVHHLVSTVLGVLAPHKHALDLLRSCFPGGSITGAPKIRAMEIIEELEPQRRGVYCGAIGYIGFDGNMDTNIAIRTLIHAHHSIRFWAGGGIVNDSVLSEEYQESFDKAMALLTVLSEFFDAR